MQKKMGTILDEDLLKKAKQEATARHITLSCIFEEALSEYLSRKIHFKQKISMVETSFGVMKLSPQIVRKISQEKIYDEIN